jgi:hypothetical protein
MCGNACPAIGTCVAGACVAATCGGDVSLSSDRDIFSTVRNVSVEVADFNGDGRQDIAVVGRDQNHVPIVKILSGDGNRGFTEPRTIATVTLAAYGERLLAGDYEGDGDVDLVVFARDTRLLLNDGAGAFVERGRTAEALTSRALGDVDGDGRLDLVGALYGLEVRSGISGPTTYYSLGSLGWTLVALGDMDGDGDLDAIVGSSQVKAIGVSLNSGNGSLAPPVLYPVKGIQDGLVLADLDRDGRLDVLASLFPNYEQPMGGLATLRNRGGGELAAAAYYESPDWGARSIATGDMNGDGAPDVAVMNAGERLQRINLFVNAGDGTLRAGPVYGDGAASELAIADLDGDGYGDLVASSYAGAVQVIWGGEAPEPALLASYPLTPEPLEDAVVVDFDGDGRLDVAAMDQGGHLASSRGTDDGAFSSPVLLAESAGLIATGDIDRDGDPDLVLANYPQLGLPSVTVLRNSAGTFTPGQEIELRGLLRLVLEDVEADGVLDALVVGQIEAVPYSKTVLLLLSGHGDATFAAPVTLIDPAANTVYGVDVADLDGDGRKDVAMKVGFPDRIQVWLATGPRTFAIAAEIEPDFPIGDYNGGIAAGDLDGDGRADLVVASQLWYSVGVLLGRGGGAFEPLGAIPYVSPWKVRFVPFRAREGRGAAVVMNGYDLGLVDVQDGVLRVRRFAGYGRAIAAGDFDGDLRPDVLLGEFRNVTTGIPGVRVLHSTCVP